jgi:hypothetical protein
MQEIKIVRLNTGEDIIASVYGGELEGGYIMSEPMSIDFQTRGQNSAVVMGYWLPTQLTEVNEVFIKTENIMCIMEPNKDFLDYYTNSLKNLKRLKDVENSVESMTDDQVTETLLAVEDLESGVHVIH